MASVVHSPSLSLQKILSLIPNKPVNSFAVASESHASTPLPTFATANLVEPQRAKKRHWHYTNTLPTMVVPS